MLTNIHSLLRIVLYAGADLVCYLTKENEMKELIYNQTIERTIVKEQKEHRFSLPGYFFVEEDDFTKKVYIRITEDKEVTMVEFDIDFENRIWRATIHRDWFDDDIGKRLIKCWSSAKTEFNQALEEAIRFTAGAIDKGE
jgi:hypothetical protein